MSNGKEFQRTDAATGNERHPTVDRQNGGFALVVMTMNKVGDDRAGRWHEPADTSKVEQDRAAREKPWLPPWNQHILADATNAVLQGRSWRGHNNGVDTPDELQR